MRMTTDECRRRLRAADHGVLCTSNPRRTIDAVPVCFAVVSETIATPAGRLRNLDQDATATLPCQRWDRDDWSGLWWVRAHLVRRPGHEVSARHAEEGERALREKYTQYADVDVKALVGWSAAPDPEAEPGGGLSLR